jgi:hypothetical protein
VTVSQPVDVPATMRALLLTGHVGKIVLSGRS